MNFEQLLSTGRISDALQLRCDEIEAIAREYRVNCEASKLATGSAALIGLVLSANPIAGIAGGIGALLWGYFTWRDWQITGGIHPIPGFRVPILQAIGAASSGSEMTHDPLADVCPWVDGRLAHEYELIQVSEASLVAMLGAVEGDRRMRAYAYILRQTYLRDALQLPPIQEVCEACPPLQSAPSETLSRMPRTVLQDTDEATQTTIEVPSKTIGGINPPALPPQWDEDEAVNDGAESPLDWDADTDDSFNWMNDLLHYPAILIYGAQGSGKTTLATWLMHQRRQLGHQVEILDPHRKYGQWEGFDVYGDGMDFEAIDERLIIYSKLVVNRYKQRSQRPDFNPKPITYLTEEFTQWRRKCRYSAPFFESTLSDIRKINMGVVFVSHARTLTGLGGAKGLADTRDNSLLEIELLAQVHPVTGEAAPTGKGKIKYPGMQPIEIAIPELSFDSFANDKGHHSTSTPDIIPPVLEVGTAAHGERIDSEQPQNDARTTAENQQNEVQNLYGIDAKSNEITLQERGLVIENIRNGERSIQKIVFNVWGVKPGGSPSYKTVRTKIDQILKDAGIQLN